MGAGDHNEGRASLAARGIVRDFGDARVLDGVDLVREVPGIVGLVGANGSGKTTLLRIIAQVVAHEGGELVVAGRTVERGDDARARRLVGWVPHEALAWRDSSVAHNLRYAARLAGLDRRGAGAAADAAIARWDLGAYREAAVRTLSRGWTQRYAFARADLLEPPVLLLDEPTNGLDVRARTALDEALDGWRSSRVVVVASHERAWLDERADEVVDLGAGRA
ncbi:MAG: transporter related protein [Thermoleophilia bacterium]|nr:transporter related protein [Thermoleophilia bacterium]